jgi:hypothetical protein
MEVPEWMHSDWYQEWLDLAKRDYHGRSEKPLDYSEIRDILIMYSAEHNSRE